MFIIQSTYNRRNRQWFPYSTHGMPTFKTLNEAIRELKKKPNPSVICYWDESVRNGEFLAIMYWDPKSTFHPSKLASLLKIGDRTYLVKSLVRKTNIKRKKRECVKSSLLSQMLTSVKSTAQDSSSPS